MWQRADESGGTAAIVRVDRHGDSVVLVEASADESERYTLIGQLVGARYGRSGALGTGGARAGRGYPCADDDGNRNAPPSHGPVLDLHLACHDGAPASAHRFDSGVEATGDVAADARALLDRLLEGAPVEHGDRGYAGLSREVGTGTIGVGEVTLTGGTLVVDFDFPDTGVGNHSTSYGSMIWHGLLVANLLQFDEVERLELRAGGTCDYGAYFEGRGCGYFVRDDAPWNAAGESNAGRYSHSTEPPRSTSAAPWQSDSSAWSAIGRSLTRQAGPSIPEGG